MSEGERNRTLWIPNPMSLVFFQADPRHVLPFLRKGPGENILPPLAPLIAVSVIAAAAWVRLWIGATVQGFHGSVAEYFDPQRGEHLVWVVFALIVFTINFPPALDNWRRRYEEEEVFCERGNRGLRYIGWPRLINARTFYAKTAKERRRTWRRTTLYGEPAIGFSIAFLLLFVSVSFALWFAVNVVLLWSSSAWIVYAERQQRLDYESAYFDTQCQKVLLNELKKKTRKRK